MRAILALFLFGISNTSLGQQAWSKSLITASNHIIHLIQNDSISELADLMPYPISNGLPPVIRSKTEFVMEYQKLFDSLAKEFIKKPPALNDSVLYVFVGHPNLLGLFTFCGEGKIESFNYQPNNWEEKALNWAQQDRLHIYDPLKNFISNKLICEADSLMLRVDDVGNKLRLTIWQKGQSMSSKPLKTLFYQPSLAYGGSLGLFKWVFKDNSAEYIIYNQLACGNSNGRELRLDIKKANHQINNYHCFSLK